MMGQLISETHFEECISNSIKYLKSYQYPQALAMIHEAMQADDTSALVYNLLGIYYEMKRTHVSIDFGNYERHK